MGEQRPTEENPETERYLETEITDLSVNTNYKFWADLSGNPLSGQCWLFPEHFRGMKLTSLSRCGISVEL